MQERNTPKILERQKHRIEHKKVERRLHLSQSKIMAKATIVFGSQDEAQQWSKRPIIGLEQQRPVDLMTTPAGVKLVKEYRGRLEYDVYT